MKIEIERTQTDENRLILFFFLRKPNLLAESIHAPSMCTPISPSIHIHLIRFFLFFDNYIWFASFINLCKESLAFLRSFLKVALSDERERTEYIDRIWSDVWRVCFSDCFLLFNGLHSPLSSGAVKNKIQSLVPRFSSFFFLQWETKLKAHTLRERERERDYIDTNIFAFVLFGFWNIEFWG